MYKNFYLILSFYTIFPPPVSPINIPILVILQKHTPINFGLGRVSGHFSSVRIPDNEIIRPYNQHFNLLYSTTKNHQTKAIISSILDTIAINWLQLIHISDWRTYRRTYIWMFGQTYIWMFRRTYIWMFRRTYIMMIGRTYRHTDWPFCFLPQYPDIR